MRVVNDSPRMWAALGVLTQLEELDLTTWMPFSDRARLVQPEVPGFRKLTVLRILDQEAPEDEAYYEAVPDYGTVDTTHFLPLAFAAPLRVLQIACGTRETFRDTAPLITQYFAQTLRELDIFVIDWTTMPEILHVLNPTRYPSPPPCEFGLRDILPDLYPLHGLTEIGIHGTAPFDLEESDVDDLTQAWPNLVRLQFTNPGPPQRHRTRWPLGLTQRAIHVIARAYPALHSLAISIDHALFGYGHMMPEEPLCLAPPVCPDLLLWDSQHSDLGPWMLDSVEFMLRYFPNLRQFYGDARRRNRKIVEQMLAERPVIPVPPTRDVPMGCSLAPAYVRETHWDDFCDSDPDREHTPSTNSTPWSTDLEDEEG
jgi:hypothetical protein